MVTVRNKLLWSIFSVLWTQRWKKHILKPGGPTPAPISSNWWPAVCRTAKLQAVFLVSEAANRKGVCLNHEYSLDEALLPKIIWWGNLGKHLNARLQEEELWKAVSGAWCSCCSHRLSVAGVAWARPSQSTFLHGWKRGCKVPLLTEELMVFDSYWEGEPVFHEEDTPLVVASVHVSDPTFVHVWGALTGLYLAWNFMSKSCTLHEKQQRHQPKSEGNSNERERERERERLTQSQFSRFFENH